MIHAEELATFGFSLVGAMDVDGNEYPDILAGAYNSRTASSTYHHSQKGRSQTYDVKLKQVNLKNKTC